MESNNTELEFLSETIRQALSDKPHLESLLNAFGPLLLAKTRWLSSVQTDTRSFPIDHEKYRGGLSCIQQCRLLLPEDPWRSAGLLVVDAIDEGFPGLGQEMKRLRGSMEDGSLDCFSLVDCPEEEVDERLTSQAASLSVSTVALQFLRRFLLRFMLTKRAREMAPVLASLTWKKGYCPICGSHPHLAVIRENGKKWLQCPTCSHEWLFPRLTCPYCDHEDPKNTNILFVDGSKEDIVFLCEKCRRYLLTAHRSATLQRLDPDVLAIGLTHLDILVQEKGFQPMAPCEWNTFEYGD